MFIDIFANGPCELEFHVRLHEVPLLCILGQIQHGQICYHRFYARQQAFLAI